MLEFIAWAALGGALRYLLTRYSPPFFGTLAANVLASGLAGAAVQHSWWGPLVMAGTLSTWSTLSKELGSLPSHRAPALLLAHLVGGALALSLGFMV